jgi:succinate-semialdehyde dehydrogenase/glutarate-semialdehyde dehydrogenase
MVRPVLPGGCAADRPYEVSDVVPHRLLIGDLWCEASGGGRLVERAVAVGAALLVGGRSVEGSGHFFEPTVLASVQSDSEIAAEELFGPVVTLTSFRDEAQAVRMANATDYGLASYVYTRDVARAQRMISAADSGMTGINVSVISNAAAPFGGIKQSGMGREGGPEGLQEYLDVKYAAFANPIVSPGPA